MLIRSESKFPNRSSCYPAFYTIFAINMYQEQMREIPPNFLLCYILTLLTDAGSNLTLNTELIAPLPYAQGKLPKQFRDMLKQFSENFFNILLPEKPIFGCKHYYGMLGLEFFHERYRCISFSFVFKCTKVYICI